MADIGSYLKKIRSAVFGEEVRGSIHDAISVINDTTEQYGEDIEEILDKFTTPINYTTSGGIFYDCSTNDDGTIGMELWTGESQNHESVILRVTPGETYEITCYRYILGIKPGISWPIIAAKRNGSGYSIKGGCGNPLHENTYIYTVPAEADTLLISSIYNSLGSIDIRKMNANQTGGAKKLWSGALYAGDVPSVNFYVPEKYWHDGNLTLLIDCVRFQSDGISLLTYPHAKTVLMCLSRYHRLFTSDNVGYYSGTYPGNGKISYGNVYESFTDKSGGCNLNIDIQAYVQPLVTTEYALVNVVKLDNTPYAITNIYAVVPTEEG